MWPFHPLTHPPTYKPFFFQLYCNLTTSTPHLIYTFHWFPGTWMEFHRPPLCFLSLFLHFPPYTFGIRVVFYFIFLMSSVVFIVKHYFPQAAIHHFLPTLERNSFFRVDSHLCESRNDVICIMKIKCFYILSWSVFYNSLNNEESVMPFDDFYYLFLCFCAKCFPSAWGLLSFTFNLYYVLQLLCEKIRIYLFVLGAFKDVL